MISPWNCRLCLNCIRMTFNKMWVLSVTLALLATETSSTDEVDMVRYKPQHVHLAFGDTVSEMVIVWATLEQCTPSVQYGNSIWAFHNEEVGKSIEFNSSNVNGLQFLHRVKLKSLESNTTYHYRPLCNKIGIAPFYFKTPPSGQEWSPIFLVYGDMGIYTSSIPKMTDEVLTGVYTAVLHIGDFAYNMHDEGGKVGDKFLEMIQGMSSLIPYMTAPGNHEINEDTFDHYRNRFSMPGSDWPIPLDKMWYSIDIGPVHLVSYSTEVFFTLDKQYVPVQHDWLMKDLEKANENRNKCPWVVVMGHRPMYCSNDDGDDCTKADSLVRAGLEDIFYHFGVDIVLQAHEHSYQRLWPQYKGVVITKNYTNPSAPVQLITGAAGSKHGLDLMSNRTDDDWSAFKMANGSLNSYGRLQVVNATHALWEQKSVLENDLIDSIWITTEKHGAFHTKALPKNISKVIEETIVASGGKPNVVETAHEVKEKETILKEDNTNRMAIGISFGAVVVLVLVGVVLVKKCRRKRKTVRRWEQMDFNYSKKLYAPAKDNEKELDNDFEIDMSDGTLPTTKLLSDD